MEKSEHKKEKHVEEHEDDEEEQIKPKKKSNGTVVKRDANEIKEIKVEPQTKATGVTLKVARTYNLMKLSIKQIMYGTTLDHINEAKTEKRPLSEMVNDTKYQVTCMLLYYAYKSYYGKLADSRKYVDYVKETAKLKSPLTLPSDFKKKNYTETKLSGDIRKVRAQKEDGELYELCEKVKTIIDYNSESDEKKKRNSRENKEIHNAIEVGYFHWLQKYSAYQKNLALLKEWNKLSAAEKKKRSENETPPKNKADPGNKYVDDPLAEISDPYEKAEYLLKFARINVSRQTPIILNIVLDSICKDLLSTAIKNIMNGGDSEKGSMKTVKPENIIEARSSEIRPLLALVNNSSCYTYIKEHVKKGINKFPTDLLNEAFELPDMKDFFNNKKYSEDDDEESDEENEEEEDDESGAASAAAKKYDSDDELVVSHKYSKVSKSNVRDFSNSIGMAFKQLRAAAIAEGKPNKSKDRSDIMSGSLIQLARLSHLQISTEQKRFISSLLIEYLYRIMESAILTTLSMGKQTIQDEIIRNIIRTTVRMTRVDVGEFMYLLNTKYHKFIKYTKNISKEKKKKGDKKKSDKSKKSKKNAKKSKKDDEESDEENEEENEEENNENEENADSHKKVKPEKADEPEEVKETSKKGKKGKG